MEKNGSGEAEVGGGSQRPLRLSVGAFDSH